MKKDEFKFRSVNSIVMAPARTGNERTSRIAVITSAQTKSGVRSARRVLGRIL